MPYVKEWNFRCVFMSNAGCFLSLRWAFKIVSWKIIFRLLSYNIKLYTKLQLLYRINVRCFPFLFLICLYLIFYILTGNHYTERFKKKSHIAHMYFFILFVYFYIILILVTFLLGFKSQYINNYDIRVRIIIITYRLIHVLIRRKFH